MADKATNRKLRSDGEKGPKSKDVSSKSNPLPPPEHKVAYVRDLFRSIARRYDLMNRLMTFGRDRAWRRYTVSQLDRGLPILDSAAAQDTSLPDRRSPMVLDVATGTGDLALETLRQRPDVRVIGLDFVPEMLALARQKANAPRPDRPALRDLQSPSSHNQYLLLSVGDALSLPFVDGAFDGVVTGFALRNVTDIPTAFAEMARVTRPGGRVACLEIAKPRTPLFRQLFGLYFYRLVPVVGGWITGHRSAYTYLPHSLTAFLTPDELAGVMRRTGWRDVRVRRLMLGTVAVHVGVRI
jgi:demethylmenaquinone methyltransferase/2-methoxy-6-polyprenyl-1,4-benzoquinol methylase